MTENNKNILLIVTFSIVIIFTIIPIILLVRDFFNYYPPSPEETHTFLTKYQNDIEIVVKYLKEFEYDSAMIKTSNAKIFFEFEWHDISTKKVKDSIHRLWRAGCYNINKDNDYNNNTISFEIWYRTMGEVDCMIACTIDGQGLPKTMYQVKCEEIADGWFYCYDDYEEYRSHQTYYNDSQPSLN